MVKKRSGRLGFDELLPGVEPPTRKGILIVVLMALAFLSLLSIFDLAGTFGRYVYYILKLVFGWGFWIFPLILILASYFSLKPAHNFFKGANWLGMTLSMLGYSGLFHLFRNPEMMSLSLKSGTGGGYVGYLILWPFLELIGMGRWGSLVVMLAMLIVGILLLFNTTLENLIERLTLKSARQKVNEFISYRRLKKIGREAEGQEEAGVDLDFEGREIADIKEEKGNDESQEAIMSDSDGQDAEEAVARGRARKKYPKIILPLELLSNKAGKPTAGDIAFCQEKIKKTLANFGIEVEMVGIAIGPTVTQYTFRPADGVKLSRILGLSNDLALALAAHPIRIEAPIPGKSLVGVEVPNSKIAIVPLRQVLESPVFKERKSSLTIALGQDVAGNACLADLARLPHLLVAGATNSGKTVCLNSIIISLLYQNQPDELKFILVDPKRVEMTSYNNIPYLLTPVVTEVKKTINALKWTISEMERRFHILSNASKRNIQSYNVTHPNDKLPYIVFIIDELATLMSVAGAEVEAAIIRLAQMARAVGIHLILATQRPSVDIITGLIKANITARIAFSVASLMDSRTILDFSGAEKLLGRGDMLYTSAELSKPKRIQGAFCSDEDIEHAVAYLKEAGLPDYVDEVTERQMTLGLGGIVLNESDGDDDLLDEARDIVLNEKKASASYLQRRLRIGYARAARILDLLEQQGVVGPADGAKPREILIKKGEKSLAEQADEILLGQENNRSRNQEIKKSRKQENNRYLVQDDDATAGEMKERGEIEGKDINEQAAVENMDGQAEGIEEDDKDMGDDSVVEETEEFDEAEVEEIKADGAGEDKYNF